MRKRILVILAALVLAAAGCEYRLGSAEEETLSWLWEDDEAVKAMILSDLHYTEEGGDATADVSGLAYADAFMDLIEAQVTAASPDVLILTGDNTKSGNRKDAAALAERLRRMKDHGIRIILTTGNHDFDGMDAGTFAEIYYDLPEMTDRDPASLSYTSIVGNVVFLAMDDGAVYPGGLGAFSAETMQWLQDMLNKYRGRPMIFLSHHNVLYGSRDREQSSNLIENEDLADLLREGGVRLVFTGHLHFQYISEKEGLWEVVSAMPFSGRHLMGQLAAGAEGAVYRAEPLDFASYDPALGRDLAEREAEALAARRTLFEGILDKEGLPPSQREAVLDLILYFFTCFEEGSVADHADRIRSDPAYETMLRALWDYNYGPWMKAMAEESRQSPLHLEIRW